MHKIIDYLTPGETHLSSQARAHSKTDTDTRALASYWCWERPAKKKVWMYHQLLCPLGLFARQPPRPASALACCVRARALADPYQPLRLFSSLHIHETPANLSCKMQMSPCGRSSQSGGSPEIRISSLKNTWMCLLLKEKNSFADFSDKVFRR